jgi:hypothetical protein
MSVEEIRWWLKELLRRHGWGTRVLGRTMGLRNPQCVMAKADGRQWIYPREQVRMSYVLKRIISGELICIPGRGHKGKAVIADNPVRLRMPLRMKFDVRTGRVGFVPLELPAPTLPSFRTLLENPQKWRELRAAGEPRK